MSDISVLRPNAYLYLIHIFLSVYMFWYDIYTIFRENLVLIAPKPSGIYSVFVCYVDCVIGYKIYNFVG